MGLTPPRPSEAPNLSSTLPLSGGTAMVRESLLNPFQQRLLAEATLIQKRKFDARGGEPARELRLWRTNFKYSLVREEVWLGKDELGRLIPQRREFSVADHAMVNFPEALTDAEIAAWAKRQGYEVRRQLRTGPTRLVSVTNATLDSVTSIIAAVRHSFPQMAGVIAERDFLVFPTLAPNDASFSQLWGMHNTRQTGGTEDADIDAPEAWEISTGSRAVLVGVIDTGVDRSHPDLAANMWTNPGEVLGNGLDDDGNGFVDDSHGWDFFSDDNDPMDENNHGTHCAGTIGAVGNNSSGVVGVCWQVSIVGVRFLGPSGGATSDAIDCVNYARLLNVDLTSNSWGGGGASSLLEDAITNAGLAGQLFIAAAGNDGNNIDLSPQYPAAYASENIVCVASSTDHDLRSSFSNYGAISVDLAAPGSAIYSTILGSSYSSFSGTSMATPHVSGAVALLKSVAPMMTAVQIKTQLLATVDPLPDFATNTVSGGRLNVRRLLEESAGPRPVLSVQSITEQSGGNGDGIHNPGEVLELSFQVHNRGNDPAQNVLARLSPTVSNSAFTLLQDTVNVGTLNVGQIMTPVTGFLVRSDAAVPTPYAEEFLISLSHGTPAETFTQRITVYLFTSSTIEGRVTNALDGTAISGASIEARGGATFSTTSDGDGRYRLNVTDGSYEVRAAALGFVGTSLRQITTPPNRRGVDFQLGVPDFGLDPPAVIADLYTNSETTRTVQMVNRGTATLQWSVQLQNGNGADFSARTLFTLPTRSVTAEPVFQDGGGRSVAKTAGSRVVPSLLAPLASLTDVTIGAMNTVWDRSVLLADLQARGAQIVTLTLPLTVSALDAVDVVIVDDEIESFTETDITRLRARVSGGAGVLCEADNVGSMAPINTLFSGTGITAYYDGFRDLNFTDIRRHRMTENVFMLREVAVGASAEATGGAFVLVQDPNGRAHAAVSSLGAGVMVFVGNEISSDSNYSASDARRFANQIVDGLMGSPDWLTAQPTSGTIPPGAARTLTLDFKSYGKLVGAYGASARFTTNIPDEEARELPVTMTVSNAPKLVLSRSEIDFGLRVQGTVVKESFMVTNVGTLPLNVSELQLTGADAGSYLLEDAAGFQLAVGEQRVVEVIFDSTAAARLHQAEVVITSNDPRASNHIMALRGQLQKPPQISVKPASPVLALYQGQSGYLDITVQNKGLGVLDWLAALDRVPAGAGSDPSWASLPGVAGHVQVKRSGAVRVLMHSGYLPPGDYVTQLHITSQDPVTPLVVLPVTMRVMAAAWAVLAQTSLQFEDTVLKQKRLISMAISNQGDGQLILSNKTSLSSAFACLSPLPQTIPAGESRTLIFEFHPTKAGSYSSSILLGANVPGKILFVKLQGRGIRAPTLTRTPSQFTLSMAPGVTSLRTILIINDGHLPLTWTPAVEPPVSWLTLHHAGETLAPGQSQALNFTINTQNLPAGKHAVKIILNSNDPAKPRVAVPINLTMSSAGKLVFTPTKKHFEEAWIQRLEMTSFAIENTGNAPVQISAITASNINRLVLYDLTLPIVLNAGDRHTVNYFFSSYEAGEFNDTFTIRTSLQKAPFVLPVTAKVMAPPRIRVTQTSLNETAEPGGRIVRQLSISNDGAAKLTWTISGLNVTGSPNNWLSPMSLTGSTKAGVTSKAAFAMDATGLPAGTQSALIRIQSNSVINPLIDVPILFTVAETPLLKLLPESLSFPATYIATSSTSTLTLQNPGNQVLIISDIQSNDAAFSTVGVSLPLTVLPGLTRSLTVRFSPSENKVYNSTLTLLSNARSTPSVDLPLSGAGVVPPTIQVYPVSVDLTVEPGAPETRTVSLFNDGGLPLNWSVTREGALNQLASLNRASGSINSNEQTDLTLSFMTTSATAAATYTGQLKFTSNDPANPTMTLPVSITVLPRPKLTLSPAALTFPSQFTGRSSSRSFILQNSGNASINITSLASSQPQFTLPSVTLPFSLSAGGSTTVAVWFTPDSGTSFSAELGLTTSPVLASTPRLVLTGTGIDPPIIQVSPTSLALTLEKGRGDALDLTLSNNGGSVLTWQAAAHQVSPDAGTLADVLTRLNNHYQSLTDLISDRYAFTEAETGNNITDGGMDMYDGGNYLRTNLGGPLSYSDNAVRSSAFMGTGGEYFTRKRPGLFVFAADLVGVSKFEVYGNLGADGSGLVNAAVMTRTSGGVDYKGFFKGVSGAYDPSVNHLVIMEDRAGVSHAYSANTDNDLHTISGLSGSVRVYYLLFSRQKGEQVSEAQAGQIMDAFLQNVALPAKPPWLTFNPSSGSVAAGNGSTLKAQISSHLMEVGQHTASIRITSNDPVTSSVDVPLTVDVTPAQIGVSPASFSLVQLQGTDAMQSELTLTALAGTSPAWTASTTTPWISLSKTSGVGSDSLHLIYSSALDVGNHVGSVSITWNGISLSVPVQLTVRAANYTQLLTDYRRDRLLGIVRGMSGQSSILAEIHPQTLAVTRTLFLPTDITDADLTTEGDWLYVISHSGRTVSRIAMATFTIDSTLALPTYLDEGTGGTYHYHIEAGRTGLIYYTDSTSFPALHVFDYDAGLELQSFNLSGSAGVGDFTITPDGNTIYAWTQYGWSNTGSSQLARLDSSANLLTQTNLSTDLMTQAPLEAQVFYSVSRDAVVTKDSRFTPTLSSRQVYTAQIILAMSAYGHALASEAKVISASTGQVLLDLSGTASTAAFTPDQTALIYYDLSTQKLSRAEVPGLPATTPSPGITDQAVLPTAPATLSWNGSPLSARYDVFLTNDAAAMATATNGNGAVYRGNTAGVSFSVTNLTFLPGQTYYWRIDTRNHDGSTVQGPVWSFRLPAVTVPSTQISMATTQGSTISMSTPLNLTAASLSTEWSVSSNQPWLTPDQPSGSGSTSLSLNFNPTGLAAGTHVAELTVTTGADTFTVQVGFILLNNLNVIKLMADPVLPYIYALHRDLAAPYDGWLLWINPVSAQVEQAVRTGADASDFIIHSTDNRLYTLTQAGTRIVAVQRQQPRQITTSWQLPAAAVVIHPGPVGRLVAHGANNSLQMHNSVTGGLVGSGSSLPTSVTLTPTIGNFLYAAVKQSSTVTGLLKYSLGSSGLLYNTSAYWNGIYEPRLTISGDGQRLFYNGKSFNTALNEIANLEQPIQSASWNGQAVFTTSAQYFASTPAQKIRDLPLSTSLMATTPDGSLLVLFDESPRQFTSIDPGALVFMPAHYNFGQVLVGGSSSTTLSVHNLSSQDVTTSATVTNAAIQVPASPFNINAGQSADITITALPTTPGQLDSTLSLAVPGQPALSRSALITGTAVTEITEFTNDFSLSAPSSGSALSLTEYEQNGLRFTLPAGFQHLGTNVPSRPHNGSPCLSMGLNQSGLKVQRPGGGLFHLLSLDLAEYSTSFPQVRVINVQGTKADLSTVTASFTLDGLIDGSGPIKDFQSFVFPSSFRDLISASFNSDYLSLDNLCFETVTAPATSSAQASFSLSETADTMDLDADGAADVWIQGVTQRTRAGEVTNHLFEYSRRSGFTDHHVGLQATQDGKVWSDLTPGHDFTIERVSKDPTKQQESLRLQIPTASNQSWIFRLVGRTP